MKAAREFYKSWVIGISHKELERMKADVPSEEWGLVFTFSAMEAYAKKYAALYDASERLLRDQTMESTEREELQCKQLDAEQRMVNAEGKMRAYFTDETRSGQTLDQLCIEYHMAYSVYEFQKVAIKRGD